MKVKFSFDAATDVSSTHPLASSGLKGEFNVEVIMAYNEHLWFIQSHTLHESGSSGEIKKMFADEIFELQKSTLLQCTRLPTIFADPGQM